MCNFFLVVPRSLNALFQKLRAGGKKHTAEEEGVAAPPLKTGASIRCCYHINKRCSTIVTPVSIRSAPSLLDLPQEVHVDILSWIYDDCTSIQQACKALNIPRCAIQPYIRNEILVARDADNKISCCICSEIIAYPYKLVDCGHVACGRCAWDKSPNGCCSDCQTKIHSRPQRLDAVASQLADAKAFWILSHKANAARRAKNEARVHKGAAGFFGIDGKPNELDPFEGVGFPADFDDIKTLDFNHLDQLPRFRKLWVTHCPADYSYSGLPKHDGSARETRNFLTRTPFLESLHENDIVLIEEELTEAEVYGKPRPDRYEVRLVGWEHLVQGNTGNNRGSTLLDWTETIA